MPDIEVIVVTVPETPVIEVEIPGLPGPPGPPGSASVALGAGTDQEVVAVNAAGTILARAGRTIAQLLARANHTGTQLASTISDFTAAVIAAATPGAIGAEVAGAVTTHVALSDPHTQYAMTDDLGSAAFSESSDFATAAQGDAVATKLDDLSAGTADAIVTASADGTLLSRAAYTIASLLAAARDRTTHTGTQVASTISDFATAVGAYITAHIGATDPHGDRAFSVQRANHTGTQLAATISDLGTLATQNGTFSGVSSGTNTGDQTNISGNAATVTTNANLTGHVTSVGNAAVLGSFTLAQLNTAISDGDLLPLAGGTMSGNIACADNEVQRPVFLDYGIKSQTKGSISGAQTIDITAGNAVTATATGAITWTFSNPAPTGNLCAIFLTLTNGGAGAQTWPASVDWDATAGAPTLTASGVDKLLFVTNDGGTIWYGFLCGKGMT